MFTKMQASFGVTAKTALQYSHTQNLEFRMCSTDSVGTVIRGLI